MPACRREWSTLRPATAYESRTRSVAGGRPSSGGPRFRPGTRVELEWEQPGDRRWLEWLAGRYTLVQYDPRGLGLSDRTVACFSLDAFERDIEAVVDRVAAGPVVLFAKVNAGPLAMRVRRSPPGARVASGPLVCHDATRGRYRQSPRGAARACRAGLGAVPADGWCISCGDGLPVSRPSTPSRSCEPLSASPRRSRRWSAMDSRSTSPINCRCADR